MKAVALALFLTEGADEIRSRNVPPHRLLLLACQPLGLYRAQHFVVVARRHDVRVAYKPVPLSEVFAQTGGLPLAKRHPARQAYRLVELQRWREKRKLAFHLHPEHWPFDAGLANRAVLAILAAGPDPDAFVQQAFDGVWENQQISPTRPFLRRCWPDRL